MNKICINDKTTFLARPNPKHIIPKAKETFRKTFNDIQSPSHVCYFEDPDKMVGSEIREMNERLRFVRNFLEILYKEGGIMEHFSGLLKLVKIFNIANCGEYAEIMKVILKINNVKKCDIYALYAKDNMQKIRRLDHCIIGLNVSKSKNNKIIKKPFIPNKHVKIIDMWWPNCFIGNVKEAQKKYKIFGLTNNDTLMLRPVKTLEPDKETINEILIKMPELKIRH